ncbi:hypothetical protein FCV25MIE_00346 [Fagus crenata]
MGKGLKPVMRWLLGKPKSKQPKPESTQIKSDSSDNDEPRLHEEEESDTEPPSPVSQQSIEAVADDSEEERPMYPPPYNPCNNPSFYYVPPTNAIAISEYQPYPDSYPNPYAYAYAYAYQSYSSENYEEQLAEGIFGVNLDSSNAHYRGDQNDNASDDFAQSVTNQAFCYDENYYPY